MRGKVYWWKEADTYKGITPAYAGKSDMIDKYIALTGDHPRLCGEKKI